MELFDFQKRSMDWLSMRPKAFLSLEQGLGKTIVAACDLQPPATVVTTAAMKYRWEEELGLWRPDLSCEVLNGRKATTAFPDVTIINYDLLPHVQIPKPKTFIVDEAHYCKNHEAKRTGIVSAIIKRVERVRLLTGTPVVSRPKDLYAMLRAIGAINIDWLNFADRYCGAWNTPWGTYDTNGHSNLEELYEILAPFMLRITKDQAGIDLPDKFHRVIELDLGDDPDAPIRAQLKELNLKDIDAPDFSIPFQAISDIRKFHGMMKLDMAERYIRDVLESERPEYKLVLFAHHRDVIDELNVRLSEFNPVVVKGGTGPEEVFNRVQTFQKDVRVKVFIGNMQAAGEGITLTAASHVIFVEPSWTPKDLSQAADRCHRYGQKDNVLVDYLVVRKSIDAMMLRSVLKKTKVIDQLVKETEMTDVNTQIAMQYRQIAASYNVIADMLAGPGAANVQPALETAAVTQPVAAAAPAAVTQPAAAPTPDLAEIRKAASEAIANGNRDAVVEALKACGAQNLSGLPAEKYGDFLAALAIG